MEESLIYPCLTLASEIAQIVENFEDKQTNADDASDFAELKVTVNLVRSTLVPFVTSPVNDVAFDICVQGIKTSVETMKKLLSDVDDDTTPAVWYEKKIALYKEDFALKQKLDQFTYLFPQGAPSKGADMIVDEEGREFWITAFGRKMLMVPWSTFFHALQSKLDKDYSQDEEAIKNFLDFSHDNFVTPFEFNVFLHWFGPLDGCCKRLVRPLRGGLLCGFVPAIEATHLLQGKSPGTYLIRFSKTHLGSFAVTFVDSRGKIKHCLLYSVQPAGVTLKNPPQVYPSLMHFASSHTNKLKHPLGTKWSQETSEHHPPIPTPSPPRPLTPQPPSIINPGSPTQSRKHEEVSWGQSVSHEDLCSVCLDNPPETVFLECGHFTCCKKCSAKVTDCPLCRRRISRVVNIYRN